MVAKNKKLNSQGVATLPTVIMITMIILAIGIGITSLSLTEVFISAGQNQSSIALSYAETGAKDALIKIARNKKYECVATDCYSIPFTTSGCVDNTACAKVSVSAGSGAAGDPKIIISTGRVKSNTKKLQVDVFFDPSLDGEIATTTWKELSD